jgi:hypothetical protein
VRPKELGQFFENLFAECVQATQFAYETNPRRTLGSVRDKPVSRSPQSAAQANACQERGRGSLAHPVIPCRLLARIVRRAMNARHLFESIVPTQELALVQPANKRRIADNHDPSKPCPEMPQDPDGLD